jgi:DNA-binding transcriptional LysR family regulator
VEHLSFTKAAEILNTTQPTISKRIADLEDELHVKLFYRSKKLVMLTPMGELLVKEFQVLDKKADEIRTLIDSINKGDVGKINVGLHGMMDINRILPNFFEDFIKTYPHIRMNIESYNFKDLYQSLLDRKLDIIFTYSFEQQNSDLNRLVVYRHNARLYFSSSLKKDGDALLNLENFKDKNLIVLADGISSESARDHTVEICRKLNYTPPDIITASSMEAMRFYLESGAGICFMGTSYRLIEDDKIDYIELTGKDFQVGTDAIWLKDNHNPPLTTCINSILKHIDSRV